MSYTNCSIMQKLLLLLLIGCAVQLQAQQEGQFSWFTYNQNFYNPAYAGAADQGQLTLLHRQQWMGFEGAPTNTAIAFSTPLAGDRVGLGIGVQRFSQGIMDQYRANMAYSYSVPLTPDVRLRLGLQGAIHYYRMDLSDPDLVTDQILDPSIPLGQMIDRYTGNVGAGLYLEVREQVFFGLSSPGFYPVSIGYNEEVLRSAEEAPHVYAYGGGRFEINENLVFRPAILMSYASNAPITTVVNTSLIVKEAFLGGISGRFGSGGGIESLNFMVGYQAAERLMIGAAYDLGLSELRDFHSGSAELLVRYGLGSSKENLENPRFFN